MITITDTLQAAAEADSRSPIFGVDVIQKRLDLQYYDSISIGTHRLVYSDNGFWVASGCGAGASSTIKACKISTLLSDDWDTGNWSAATGTVDNPYVHDLYIDGNDCYIFFEDIDSNVAELWEVTSSDGGENWGSPSLIANFSSAGTRIYEIAIINETLVWVSWGIPGTSYYLYRFEYDGSWSFTNFTAYTSHEMFTFMASGEIYEQQMFARPIDDYTDALIFNSIKGLTIGDQWQGVFTIHTHNAGFIDTYSGSISHVKTALGCLETELDYTYQLRGLSRDTFGGFYIGAIHETYNEYADAGGESSASDFFLCRTKDGISYQLIPVSIPVFTWRLQDGIYVGGVTTDTDGTPVIVFTRPTLISSSSKIVYADASWLTGYETGTAIESDVVEQISINRSVRESSKITIQLANSDDNYVGNPLVTEGNMVRIEAGYKTTSGDETQRRFTGEITAVNHTYEPDKITSLDVYDALYPATLKIGRPHVLFGQNTFRADFSVTDDDKKMIDQAGVWALSSSKYVQTEKEVNAFSLCGYDPDDIYSITIKLRANTNIVDVKMGIVVGYDPDELTSNICTILYFNQTTGYLEYGYIDKSGVRSVIDGTIESLSWSANTDYWIRVDRGHGSVQAVWVSTDGVTWDGVGNFLYGEISPKSYPGIYCYLPSSATSVDFSIVEVVSHRPPQTGSDVMHYLAATVGVGTDEKYATNDTFSGTAFSDDWIEGPEGSWSVSGGAALGVGGQNQNTAEACVSTFTVTDVVVTVYLQSTTDDTGVSLRSNCNNTRYQATINSTTFKITKYVDGSSTNLCTVDQAILIDTSDVLEVTFSASGPWLCLFVNKVLVAYVYDEDIESGYVGIVSETESPAASDHREFVVSGFYKPIPGVVTINANDTPIAVMSQLADMLPGGQFFCNEDGDLRWGVFPEDAGADLDIEDIILSRSSVRGLDKLITSINAVGNMAYANSRVAPWAIRLSRHLWDGTEDKLLSSGPEILQTTTDRIMQTHRIVEQSVEIRANPAIELCDIVTIESGTVYLYDTFTDTNGTDLDAHTPDVDLNGGGWQCSEEEPNNPWEIQSNAARGGNATDLTWIDVGAIDFVAEFDFHSEDISNISLFRFLFRGNSGSIASFYKVSFLISDVGVVLHNPGSTTILDGVDIDGFEDDSLIHVKLICNGVNAVAEITILGRVYTLYTSAVATDSNRTYIGLDISATEGYYGIVDNLVVSTPDNIGQVLSMSEQIGYMYEMGISGLLGGREYK